MLTDRCFEVLLRAETPLETGARNLERVATGKRVGVVEENRNLASKVGEGIDIDPAGPVDENAQHATSLFDIEQLELPVREQGCNERANAVLYRHLGALLSQKSRRGQRPRLTKSSRLRR